MPLTKEQASRVRHEVDQAGLVNQRSCDSRITDLSAELQCNVNTMKNFINNYRQSKKRKATNVHTVPAAEPEPTHDQQLVENPSISAHLQELNDIVVQRPRKVRVVALEKLPGYHLFLRKLGTELKDVNKELKRENSQAELIPMNEFQMVTSDDGVLCSKWAALSQNERDKYERMASSQTLANKENVESTGGSIEELHKVQRRAYLTMVTAIRNFVKLGGTHIATSRLPYESEENRRIVSVAFGDLAEETTRQAAKGDVQYQTAKVLTFLDLRQRMGPKSSIIAVPKVAIGGVQIRRATFQGDLLRKFQKLKPEATRVPLKDLREGKVHGVQMTNWPSSVTKFANFNEKELDILEQNPVSFVESTNFADDLDVIGRRTLMDENFNQESAHIDNHGKFSGQGLDLGLAASEMEALDAAMSSGSSSNSPQLEIPACNGV
ncbi:hypothetical protein HDU80_010303 [Chytriomyces hyalinus]|nr:hypothetical protein HDU80_010303 [Chytriomyces hyalinus]